MFKYSTKYSKPPYGIFIPILVTPEDYPSRTTGCYAKFDTGANACFVLHDFITKELQVAPTGRKRVNLPSVGGSARDQSVPTIHTVLQIVSLGQEIISYPTELFVLNSFATTKDEEGYEVRIILGMDVLNQLNWKYELNETDPIVFTISATR